MRLLTSEGNTATEQGPFDAWLAALSQSSDAALGGALAVHALGAADALCDAAREDCAWGPHRDMVEAIARPCLVTDVHQLRAYCMDVAGARRWAILVPRAHTLLDIVVWEHAAPTGYRGAGILTVAPMVHRSERFAHVGWLANAAPVLASKARDALAAWVLASPDAQAPRAVLRPYAWLLDVEPAANDIQKVDE